ncbi:hypothetical protein A5881_002953 [Enterococcus termitis]|nr:hypothetical protein A5881_002392 [Enterococcus termitis]
MTEKTRLLESAISEIDRVLLGNKSADVNEVYLNNAKRYIRESMTDRQPAFAVGEYYYSYYVSESFFKVTGFRENFVKIKEYNKTLEKVSETEFKLGSPFGNEAAPATAEQIATFKRAEHFASKGRKLDEFRVGDLVNCKSLAYDNGYYVGNLVISRINKQELTGRTDENLLYTYALPNFKKIELIQTAEELREVGDGKNRKD